MRIIYLGTPEFAVPTLEKLLKWTTAEVVALVTQPDRPAGRGKHVFAPPTKMVAERAGIPVLHELLARDRHGMHRAGEEIGHRVFMGHAWCCQRLGAVEDQANGRAGVAIICRGDRVSLREGVRGEAATACVSGRTLEYHATIPTAAAEQKLIGYCWRIYFKVLGVLFLGEAFPAFWPSKKACGIHKFRHLGVRQQYPEVL